MDNELNQAVAAYIPWLAGSFLYGEKQKSTMGVKGQGYLPACYGRTRTEGVQLRIFLEQSVAFVKEITQILIDRGWGSYGTDGICRGLKEQGFGNGYGRMLARDTGDVVNIGCA